MQQPERHDIEENVGLWPHATAGIAGEIGEGEQAAEVE